MSEKRGLALKQLKDQNAELKLLENEILDKGLKVQTIKEQNDKFIQVFSFFSEIQMSYFFL